MKEHVSPNHVSLNKVSAAGLLVALGIIFGDIGTSPLYVMKAIIGEGKPIRDILVMGGLSAIFWTLTLQTTLKYVVLTLRADNNGEGGISALYALVGRHSRWLYVPAIIGGSTLLAESLALQITASLFIPVGAGVFITGVLRFLKKKKAINQLRKQLFSNSFSSALIQSDKTVTVCTSASKN